MIEGRGARHASTVAPVWRPTRHDRVTLARSTATLLKGLGSDAAGVARTLADAGVQGQPADARQCAMAMYLRAVMAGDPRVSAVRVFHDRVVVASPGRFRQRRVAVPLPASIRAFVAGFDAQRYPGLVRRLPASPCTAVTGCDAGDVTTHASAS